MTSTNARLILSAIDAYQSGDSARMAAQLDAAQVTDRALLTLLIGGLAALFNSAGRDASQATELLSAIAEEEVDQ
ncbi:hypothetical protein AB3M83_07600 [Microbacterium sp. 179-B 1A2 NHS]|uniref:hypothetical protein n=1 Tax=Microbacterium sp. 179-B 1A2 NHS TaxID=3142383 RepID=UPI0039A0DC71